MDEIEEFRQQLLAKTIRIEDWLGAEDGDGPKRPDGYPKAWSPSEIAHWLANRYREQLAWDVSLRKWRRYFPDEGIWKIEPVECVRGVICTELEVLCPLYTVVKRGRPRTPSFGDRLIREVEALMKYHLAVRE